MFFTKLAALLSGAAALLATSLADAQPKEDPAAQAAVAIRSPQFFVTQAALHNLFIIQVSQLASERAESDAVKTLAQLFIQDHRRLQFSLKEEAEKAKLKPPHELDQPRRALLERVAKIGKGKDFDRAWLEMQREAHQTALQLHTEYAKKGDHKELKITAGVAEPVVEHHLRQLQQIAKQ
jgi:putative membrane protein